MLLEHLRFFHSSVPAPVKIGRFSQHEAFMNNRRSRFSTDMKSVYELGATSYVIKPVQFETFVEAMKQLGMYWLMVNHPLK